MTIVPGRRHGGMLGAIASALTGSLLATDALSAPLEVYARLPSLEDVAISPDGSRLAYVHTNGDERIVAVVSLPARAPLGAVKVGSEKLRAIEWADNDRLLITTSMVYPALVLDKDSCAGGHWMTNFAPDGNAGTGGLGSSPKAAVNPIYCTSQKLPVTRDWSLLQVYDLNSHVPAPIPQPSKVRELTLMNVIAGQPMARQVDGHSIVIVPVLYLNKNAAHADKPDENNALLPALLRVDLDTGEETVLRQGSRDTQQWLTDASGNVVAEQDYFEQRAGANKRWSVRIERNGQLEEAAFGPEATDYPRLLGFGPAPGTLLLQAVDGDDWVWKPLSLKDGSLGPPMSEGRILSAPIEQRATYRLIGGMQTQDDSHYVFFDSATQGRWDALVRSFAGAHVQLVSLAADFSKIAVRIESPTLGFKYEVVDFSTHKADPIGDVYEGVTAPLEARRITYAAGDGLQIPAYVTLPRGREARDLALIVLPHVAPTGVDTADFDWWSQALADQGYAVLRANFRGSQLSRRFVAAGVGELGRKMQTDLSDGVRYLVRQGIADPKRVCIVGAGYGGYAALAGVTLDPGVYRCAVAVDGVSDLGRWQKTLLDNHFRQISPEQRDWGRLMGGDGANKATLDRISPVRHVDAVHVPVMLIHGQDDISVPFEQSQDMYDALRHAGSAVELVTLPHEDHLFSGAASRLLMLQKSVNFLRTHNPPD
jgi:dipeptidyl aminopeptidase/acylaminoacyl peptidase